MSIANPAMKNSADISQVALAHVEVTGHLKGLLAEIALTQVYRNEADCNIEAVYTFPLPIDAVLLGLELELNGRQLKGVIKARGQAEATYEDAIVEGDAAILLTEVRPGTYAINVGNLAAGETARIHLRYAQLLAWQQDRLRFRLPTTIAPRFGDPHAARFRAHEVPEQKLTADYAMALNVTVHGALAKLDFECPTHGIAVTDAEASRTFSLAGQHVVMDRDVVISLARSAPVPIEGQWARDGEEYIALAGFQSDVPAAAKREPRHLQILIDCSGSMAGDSIAQARLALHEILASLEPADTFNLMTFGSDWHWLFAEPVSAEAAHIREASDFVATLEANLGGTQMAAALRAAIRAQPPAGGTDLLLITDGHIHDDGRLLREARSARCRIFTVGVGLSVTEETVSQLARETGGACELVTSGEDMASRIVAHFRRIGQAALSEVQMHWPQAALDELREPARALFAGDTVHAFARFHAIPTGTARLTTKTGEQAITAECEIVAEAGAVAEGLSDLARIAAFYRIRSMDAGAASAMAEHYQLVTAHTSCVLVAEREDAEKATALPALRQVPHTLAAGYGGFGGARSRPLISNSKLHSGTVACLDEPARFMGRAMSGRCEGRSYSYARRVPEASGAGANPRLHGALAALWRALFTLDANAGKAEVAALQAWKELQLCLVPGSSHDVSSLPETLRAIVWLEALRRELPSGVEAPPVLAAAEHWYRAAISGAESDPWLRAYVLVLPSLLREALVDFKFER